MTLRGIPATVEGRPLRVDRLDREARVPGRLAIAVASPLLGRWKPGDRVTRGLAWIAFAVVAAVALTSCEEEEVRQGLSVGEPVTAPSRARPELAVVRLVTGNPPRRDVIVLDSSRMNKRVLATGARFFGSRPSWSPGGARLVFARSGNSKQERSDIFVVDAGGGSARRLTQTGRAFAPVWSPDGRTIVFAQRSAGARYPSTSGLWAMTSDGSNRRELLEAKPGRVDVPSSFSPDGNELAVTRCESREPDRQARVANACAVYLFDVRTLELRKLVERAAEAAFSPDGDQIAYVTDSDENGSLSYGDRTSYANELYVMRLDNGDTRRLTRTYRRNERAPSWSSDGNVIAYQRGQVIGNAEGTVVVLVRADGNCARLTAFDPKLAVWHGSPSWRPGSAPVLTCE